jgi:HlyD family secretion protein
VQTLADLPNILGSALGFAYSFSGILPMRISLVSKDKPFMPWLIGLAVVGLVAVPATWWLKTAKSNPKVDLAELTVPVKAEDLTVRITASGSIAPSKTVNLSPKTAGRVAELFVEQGDFVQAGQAIARMDSQELQARRAQFIASLVEAEERLKQLKAPARNEVVLQAEADTDRAQNEIKRGESLVADAQSQLEFAQTQRKRQQDLADQGAISSNSLDEFIRKETNAKTTLVQAQAQLEQAKAGLVRSQQQAAETQKSGAPGDIRQAEARVAAAAAQVQQIEDQLADTVVRAPFAGQVTQRYATEGAFVTPTTQASASGTGASSTSIIALASDLEVVAKVPEVDIGQIKRGQIVEIKVDAFPKESFKGRVRLIAPEAIEERDVKFFQVRIALLTGKEKLRSGMNADLSLLGESLTGALVVPTVAISPNKRTKGVWIPDEKGEPEFQAVKVGITQDNQTQILSGLKAGDRVFMKLPEGKKLQELLKDQKSSGGTK